MLSIFLCFFEFPKYGILYAEPWIFYDLLGMIIKQFHIILIEFDVLEFNV